MSSMRNAVQRRNHQERPQPLEREKWGLLEKHKDYSLRAKDHGEKRARLRILRQKAAERNPDEFHYGMLSSRSNKGRKLANRGNPSLGQDAVKLLKTQDMSYLQSMLRKTQRAIQRLEHEFVLAKDASVDVLGMSGRFGQGQHVILVDDAEAQRRFSSLLTAESHMEQWRSLAYRKDQENGGKDVGDKIIKQQTHCHAGQEILAAKQDAKLRKTFNRGQKAQRAKLAALKSREKDLRNAWDELECQRAKISNSVGGVTKTGLKWRTRERKD